MSKWQGFTKQVPFTSFVCKPLPKDQWLKFKAILDHYRVDSGTLFLASFLSLRQLGRNDEGAVDRLIDEAARLLKESSGNAE